MGKIMLHTCIRVVDLEKSIQFYSQLGFYESKRMEYPEQGFSIVYMNLEGGDYSLELTYNEGVESYVIGDGYSHIAIGVDYLEVEHERCIELGYETTPLKGLPGKTPNYFFVTDPDGYKVEVIRNK